MKKLCSLMLCLLTLAALIPLPSALAGTDVGELNFYVSGGGNKKVVKFSRKAEVVAENTNQSTFPFEIKQIAPPIVEMQPDGEAIVPLTLAAKAYDYPLNGGKLRATISGLCKDFVDPNFTVKDNVLFIDLSLKDGEKQNYVPAHIIDVNTSGRGWSFPVGEWFGDYTVTYSANGFTADNDLSLTAPDLPGLGVDPASKPEHLILTLPKGTPLPAMTAFKAALGDKKTRVNAFSGFYTQGKSKTFLPVEDEKILARYPKLEDSALITFMQFDKRNKTTHYAVVEVKWK